jgi:N-acetylmuramoyl-L-alanine amidase
MIPDRTVRVEDRPVDKRHKFVKKGGSVSLRLRVLAQGKPIANAVYILQVGHVWFTGQTDRDGKLHHEIPHEATVGLLKLPKRGIEFPLEIGNLDPISEIEGVQARLNNLGFYCGAVDGVIGPMTRSALSMFQETWNLEITGQADEQTCAKLKEKYGC